MFGEVNTFDTGPALDALEVFKWDILEVLSQKKITTTKRGLDLHLYCAEKKEHVILKLSDSQPWNNVSTFFYEKLSQMLKGFEGVSPNHLLWQVTLQMGYSFETKLFRVYSFQAEVDSQVLDLAMGLHLEHEHQPGMFFDAFGYGNRAREGVTKAISSFKEFMNSTVNLQTVGHSVECSDVGDAHQKSVDALSWLRNLCLAKHNVPYVNEIGLLHASKTMLLIPLDQFQTACSMADVSWSEQRADERVLFFSGLHGRKLYASQAENLKEDTENHGRCPGQLEENTQESEKKRKGQSNVYLGTASAPLRGYICINRYGSGNLKLLVDHIKSDMESAGERHQHQDQNNSLKAALVCMSPLHAVSLHTMFDCQGETSKHCVRHLSEKLTSLHELQQSTALILSDVTRIWGCQSRKYLTPRLLIDRPILVPDLPSFELSHKDNVNMSWDDPRLGDPAFAKRIFLTSEAVLQHYHFEGGLYMFDDILSVQRTTWNSDRNAACTLELYKKIKKVKTSFRAAFFPSGCRTIETMLCWLVDVPVSRIDQANVLATGVFEAVSPLSPLLQNQLSCVTRAQNESANLKGPSISFPLMRVKDMMTGVPLHTPKMVTKKWSAAVSETLKLLDAQNNQHMRGIQVEMLEMTEALAQTAELDTATQQFYDGNIERLNELIANNHALAHRAKGAYTFLKERCAEFEDPARMHECPICLSEMRNPVMNIACGHSLCLTCMDQYCRKNPGTARCPQCRMPVAVKSTTLAKLNLKHCDDRVHDAEVYGSKMVELVHLARRHCSEPFVLVVCIDGIREIIATMTAHSIITATGFDYHSYSAKFKSTKPHQGKLLLVTLNECFNDVTLDSYLRTAVLFEPLDSPHDHKEFHHKIIGKFANSPVLTLYSMYLQGTEEEAKIRTCYAQEFKSTDSSISSSRVSAKRKREEIF